MKRIEVNDDPISKYLELVDLCLQTSPDHSVLESIQDDWNTIVKEDADLASYDLQPVAIEHRVIASIFNLSNDDLTDVGSQNYFALTNSHLSLLVHYFARRGNSEITCLRARVLIHAGHKIIPMPRKRNKKNRHPNIWTESIIDFAWYLKQMLDEARYATNPSTPRKNKNLISSADPELLAKTIKTGITADLTEKYYSKEQGQSGDAKAIVVNETFQGETDESQRIGYWGEKLVYLTLRNQYEQYYPLSPVVETASGFYLHENGKILLELDWRNKNDETGSSPDMILHEEGREIFIEVKTTRNDKYDYPPTEAESLFYLSKGEDVAHYIVTRAETQQAQIWHVKDPMAYFLFSQPSLTESSNNKTEIKQIKQRQPENKSVRFFEGVGRRKTSTARVRLYPEGDGKVQYLQTSRNSDDSMIELQKFFPRNGDIQAILKPLNLTEYAGKVDIVALVKGGGVSGQVGAIQLGLARALVLYDPATHYVLRSNGLLTRDSRAKERKKPGLKRARKAPTYTKR